ncbi:MAG TPA: D-alanine--D-alanine ligase [Ignavibacteriales bacterium]|nr:D-alanine--D-alanine ligase [Ignavibacteriales bacterium]
MEDNLRNKKILICYPKPYLIYENYAGKNHNKYPANSETELENEIYEIYEAIKINFPLLDVLAVGDNLSKEIKFILDYSPDLLVNLVESYRGNSKGEIYFASLLELLNIKYTGNKPDTLTNCLDKNIAKLILKANNLNTPNFAIVSTKEELMNIGINYPVIIKLNAEDASIGISEFSVCYDLTQLLSQFDFLSKTYPNQSYIIEEYIDGREFNVAIFNKKVLPISEIIFELPDNLPKIVTYEAKWDENSLYYNKTLPQRPANITNEIAKLLTETALAAYNSFNCCDGVRVDIRLDINNIPYILEVNPNPDLTKSAGFFGSYKITGKSYSDFFYELITTYL